jgi:hypothetical protein
VLAEWAERVNTETRAFMRVSISPELPERQEARAYLSGFLNDEEAAARVAADLERVWALCGHQDEEDDDGWDREAWAAAGREYHRDRSNRVALVEYTPAQLARLRGLLDDSVTLERAWAEVSKPPQVPIATLHAAEFLLQQKDPAQMRRWLSRHSAPEREAILRHLEQRKKRGGGDG